jgi:hypothetical protein
MCKFLVLAGVCFSTVLSAAPLQIVNVSAPEINCFFSTNCKVSGHDVVGFFTVPETTGEGMLLSRTYAGQPGAPLVGYGAYVYRIDVSGIHSGSAGTAAVESLTVAFPPEIIPRDYGHTGITNSQVWVITGGGLGTINLGSATSTGTNITFVFSPPIPCANGTNAGQSSYFFGVVSTNATFQSVAQIQTLVGTNLFRVNASNTSPRF